MTLDTQVSATVLACHLQSLRQLRSSLPRGVAQRVACVVIGSRLDYCTSLYCGMFALISKGYIECRMLLHELFAKLHDVNSAQSIY